jgi:hypothetical protein
VIWGFLAVGVFFSPFLLYAAHPFFLRFLLRRRGQDAEGVFIGYQVFEGTHFCWYEFTDEELGLPRSKKSGPVSGDSPAFYPGDTVHVVYDKKKPSRSLLAHEMKVPPLDFVMLGAILLSMAGCCGIVMVIALAAS